MNKQADGPAAPAPRRHAAPSVYQIEVGLKSEFPDPRGASALALLRGAGLSFLKEARTATIYLIRGPLTLAQIHQASRELLCDGVTQEYRLAAPRPILNGMNHWRVEVWLMPQVTDAAGETAAAAFADVKLPRPESVRVGAVYYLTGRVARQQLEKTASRWLANPLIHRVNVMEAPR